MGTQVKVELDEAAVRAFMQSGGVADDIGRRTRAVASAAGYAKAKVETQHTRTVGTVSVDTSAFAKVCKHDKPFKHPNCSATKALRDSHINLMAGLGAAK